MNCTFNEVQNILNTLPIGYYVGRNIDTILSNESSSYYELINDKIHISYPMIRDAIQTINESNVEMVIRSLLYHEVSHAFLTPEKITIADYMNVFEDERIETVTKTYFMNVNFKQLLHLINGNVENQKPKTKDEAWYLLIRYRKGEQKFLDEVQHIIDNFYNLHKLSTTALVASYNDKVYKLYTSFCTDFNNKQNNQDEQSRTQNENKFNNTQNTEQYEQNEQNEQNEQSEQNGEQDNELTFEKDEVKRLFSLPQQYYNENITSKLFAILNSTKKMSKITSSAINTHSGVFDYRSVIRDDYKWFVQENRQGHIKRFSKLKLNLFIDNSGSFCDHVQTINQILVALKKIQHGVSTFNFDVVTMNEMFVLQDKNYVFDTYGSNDIPDNAKNILLQVQDKSATNVNIVLFDGYAFSKYTYMSMIDKSNFAIFNMHNTTMILEHSNRNIAERYCPKAYRIYSTDYDNQLMDNICCALQKFL